MKGYLQKVRAFRLRLCSLRSFLNFNTLLLIDTYVELSTYNPIMVIILLRILLG